MVTKQRRTLSKEKLVGMFVFSCSNTSWKKKLGSIELSPVWIFDDLMWKPAIIQFIIKEAIFQPFWFVFFLFHPDAKKLNRLNCIQIANQNQPNKQTASTEPLYGKSVKRHSGLKNFTIYLFYSLFLEISIDDLNKRKIKFKKSQTLYDKRLNLRV